MDQPTLNTASNRQMSDRQHNSRHLLDLKPRNAFSFRRPNDGDAKRFSYLLPALLAVVTGVVLGVLLLVLFKDQAAEPTVTTIPAIPGQTSGTPAVKGAAELPAQSLYVWQLGSFPEKAKAEKAQQDLAAQCIVTTLRGEGPYQLFSAVAPDKKSNTAFEAELNKRKITFYAKEFKISERQGYIANLKDADARTVVQELQSEAKLGLDAMNVLTSAKPDSDKLAALKTNLTQLSGQQKASRALLLQAGLSEEAGKWDALFKQLQGAVDQLSAGTPNLLESQAKLTAFFVEYEDLGNQLIRVQ
ncbi:hypothetical protein [Tumebacillus flagellatus]|uniref:SPOR domain-containing protein n=1 Tax=Tumebacillus flagellatus TaxID=1157490 RepID=A0A074LSC7_9BACL|nr:hypothetical protein [Tumebacillus flagellatus]KEO82688.1 hypothetical protein EL26_14070 [Tumebacillus flagellatus]